MQIRKAERKKAKLRLGIAGASGSGKTWSALTIARGMGGKIGMIDTESGRGELYGNEFEYDIIRLEAPFSPERYIEAIKTFEKNGYDILIIDSLSHAWVGEGGVLSIVDRAGSKSFSEGWRVATPKQNALIDALVTSKMHIITTFRVKTEYVVEKNESGKIAPRKVGLAPVQRDGVEYEFTVFMDMNQEHIAHVTKDNTRRFDGNYVKPTEDMGKHLMAWLNEGVEVETPVIQDVKQQIDKSELMNQYMQKLTCADSLDELKIAFVQAYNFAESNAPDKLKQIIEEKDNRKVQLFKEKEEKKIDMEINEKEVESQIAIASKYSNNLVQMSRGV